MTVFRIMRVFSGTLVLISLAFGAQHSPFFVNNNFLWLAVFVGANLFQSGITRFCVPDILLRKMGCKEC